MNNGSIKIGEARALQSKLRLEEKLPIAYAAILADDAMNRFDPRVLEGVKLWVNGELTDDFGVEDATIAEIRKYTGLTGFKALAYMDIYLKNPDFIRYDVDWLERRFV